MLTKQITCILLKRINTGLVVPVAHKGAIGSIIGNREVVAWGVNSVPHYIDRVDFPFPAVRFKEIKGDLICLNPVFCSLYVNPVKRSYYSCSKLNGIKLEKYEGRQHKSTSAVTIYDKVPDFYKKPLKEKEKKDWKNLTLEEKKALYRASYCLTFAEMNAPTGQWKAVFAMVFFFLSCGLWTMILLKKFVHGPLPESTTLESKQAQLRRRIELMVDPINGIASKWDYEKDDWK